MRAGRTAALAVLLASALLGGCKTVDPATVAPEDPQDKCLRAFIACAPPVRYPPDTDVEGLELRKLVHVASRIDMRKVSVAAAKRLRKLAGEADMATLLELEAALEDTDNVLGKCQCEEIRPEIEGVGVREIVSSRVPARHLRSPATWTGRIAPKLAEIRELTRRSASLAINGSSGAQDDTDARVRAAELEVCETVHAARAMLSPEAFEGMVQAVYLKRETDAGAGSAESARRTIRGYARASTCEPKAVAAAN